MARAKKSIATRKKTAKRAKTTAKPARKKAAKRATPKKRPAKTRAKMTPRKMPRQSVAVVEDTVIDAVDEPVPGVVRVTEYETIRTTTPKPGVDHEPEE